MVEKRDTDPGAWQVLSRRYLVQAPPYFTLREDHVRMPSGHEIPRYWVAEFPPWVNVIAVTRAQQIVLVRQYRPGLAQVHYELPAGFVDPVDAGDLEVAARRELREETGYAGGRWSHLCTLAPNPALQDNLSHTFLAEDVELLDSPHPEAGEDLRVHLVARDDIRAIIDRGELVQALHVAPLLRFLLRQSAIINR